MEFSPLLGPVVSLVGWSLVMLLWTAIARAGAFRRLGVNVRNIPRGSRGEALDQTDERRAQWKAHNYNHLMEQPTIFYAIVMVLILMRFDHQVNVWLAWAYVALRVAHSIVQATINIVKYRLALFALATFCLLGLTVHAAARLIHG
jgi:hypothetical protein